MQRRQFLGAAGAAFGASLAGCSDRLGTEATTTGSSTDTESAPTSLSTMSSEGSVTVPVYQWGIARDSWADRGIDLGYETASFGKYNRQVTEELTEVGAPSTVAQLNFIDKGEPLTFVGQELNMFNRMFVHADDESIDDPTDLADKRLGLPASLGSTTSTVHRALVDDEYGFDIVEDTAETRAAPPPQLWESLHDGDLDAISEFSGFTIRGIAADSVRTVFDPHELWVERTGVGIPTTTFTVRRGWLAENAETVDEFLAGWQESLTSFRENAATALEEYGDEAGLEPEEAETTRELMDDGVVFGPAYYDDDLADAHWQFFELLADADAISLGEKDTTFTTAGELRS